MMKNPFKVLIITCWILLLLCCIAKLFGANWFIASTNNQNFLDFCKYIEETFWFYIFTAIFNIVTCGIYYMAVLKQNKPDLRWLIPLIIYAILKSIFYKQKILFFILDFVMTLGLPLLLDHKRWLWIIIGVALTFAFQYISMFLKLDNYNIFSENAFVSMVLSIDYIIMLLLYWLYSIRNKEV